MNDEINANIDSASKLADLHAKYQTMMIERRKADLAAMQQSIAIETDRLVLNTKIWSFQEKRRMYLGYLAAGSKCTQDLRQLKYAFSCFRYADECDPGQWYKVRSAWLLVSKYVPAEWKVSKLDTGEMRVSFLARTTLHNPQIGSQDHIDLLLCLGQCGGVLAQMYSSLAITLEKIKQGGADVWKQADWTAK